jgi:hypothetical protein
MPRYTIFPADDGKLIIGPGDTDEATAIGPGRNGFRCLKSGHPICTIQNFQLDARCHLEITFVGKLRQNAWLSARAVNLATKRGLHSPLIHA